MKTFYSFFICVFTTLSLQAQSTYLNNFKHLDLLGIDIAQGDFSKIDLKIDSLEARGVGLRVFGNYSLDSFRDFKNFKEDVARIKIDQYLAIGIYDISKGQKAHVKIEHASLPQDILNQVEYEIETLISARPTYRAQALLDVVSQCIDIFLGGEGDAQYYQLGDLSRNIDSTSVVNAYHELRESANFLSLSGIPFTLPPGTFVNFVKGSVSCKACNDDTPKLLTGTVFSFHIGEDFYKPTVFENPSDSTKTYFGGYSLDGTSSTLYPSIIPYESNPKIYLGITTRECSGIEWKQFEFEKEWVDDVTPSKIGGPLVHTSLIQDQLKTKIVEEFHVDAKTDNLRTTEKEVTVVYDQVFAPYNCDFEFDPIQFERILASNKNILRLRHKSGRESITYITKRGKINRYEDNESVPHFRVYDLQRKQWTPIYIQENTDFINGLNGIAEGVLTMMADGAMLFGGVYLSIVIPQSAGKALQLTASVLTDIAIGGLTYLITGDEKAAAVEIMLAIGGGASSLFFKAKAAKKLYKSRKAAGGSGSLSNLSSTNYKTSKHIAGKGDAPDIIRMSIRQKDGTYKTIDLEDLHGRMRTELKMSEDDFIKFADDLDALGKDHYELIGDWGMIRAWKRFSENLTSPSKKWTRTQIPLLKRMSEFPEAIQDKVIKYYNNHSSPSGFDPPGPIRGVHFDEFGHPRFESFVPKMAGGKGKIVYNPDKITGQPQLNGVSDIGKANTWAANKYGPDFYEKISNNRFKIKEESGNWVECVWHHHEDGKNMIPVLKSVHDKALSTGVAHTGGARILKQSNNLRDLIGFFTELKLD